MNCLIRPAQEQEREAFLGLVHRKTYDPYQARGITAHSLKIQRQSHYRAQWDHSQEILLAEQQGKLKGFLVLGRQCDPVTQEVHTCIEDYWGANLNLRKQLLRSVRSRCSGRLVTELCPSNSAEMALFKSQGYTPEICRVARACHEWTHPCDGPWQVRPAVNDDRLLIMHLNAISLPITVPPGGDLEKISIQFINYYNKLLLEKNPELLILILQKGRRDAGFLVLQRGFPSPNLAFVFDIAIEMRYQGQGAAQYLVNAGSDAAFREGFQALTGDISAANPKALKTAVQGLGFEIERERWAAPEVKLL